MGLNIRNTAVLVGLGAIALLAISTITGSFYTVDQGQRAIVLRNGEISNVADPGLHWKVPFIDTAEYRSVRDDIKEYPLQAYSRDQQVADILVSVTYRLAASELVDIYKQYGTQDAVLAKLIDPEVAKQVKIVFGGFDAITSITNRERLNVEIADRLAAAIPPMVEIVGVQVQDVSFSDAYDDAVEQRMKAQVEVERAKQTLELERVNAQIVVTKAQGNADSILLEAEATAKSIKVKGQSEAEVIDLKGKALRDNPELVELTKAETWNGQLPTTMIPNGAIPFLDVGPRTVVPTAN